MKRKTKISKALAFLAANPEATRYAAAKHAKFKRPATLYNYLVSLKLKQSGICPSCGQALTTKTLGGGFGNGVVPEVLPLTVELASTSSNDKNKS